MVAAWQGGAHSQTGATTLLITLMLMMSVTIVTLAVARTLVVEQRMTDNQNWHTRLFLEAEAGLTRGLAFLNQADQTPWWQQMGDGDITIEAAGSGSVDGDVRTDVILKHLTEWDGYLRLQATARRNDGSDMAVRVSQFVRPLSVLTPTAESAPPLIVNGCLTPLPISVDIRPQGADSAAAGDAAWLAAGRRCSVLKNIDTHGGRLTPISMEDDLWSLVFSVSRETFASMATEQEALAEGERQYWMASEADLDAGRWDRSLGSADRPVALVFPATTGCPEFSPGVRLHGLVFIDSGCRQAIAGYGVAIFGSLVVNGGLNIRNSELNLNHIQSADPLQTRLRLPILRSVPVPGSWRDFES
jgi:hypothetical protein